jgi:hypothetical protein
MSTMHDSSPATSDSIAARRYAFPIVREISPATAALWRKAAAEPLGDPQSVMDTHADLPCKLPQDMSTSLTSTTVALEHTGQPLRRA